MQTIIVSDAAYRLAATSHIIHCMGVKLTDGSWSVLIESDVLARLTEARHGGETPSETIVRLETERR